MYTLVNWHAIQTNPAWLNSRSVSIIDTETNRYYLDLCVLLCLRPFWCPLPVISTWPKSVTWPSPHFKKGAWGGGRRGSRMKDSIEKFGGRKIHSYCDKILQTESDSHRILSPEYVWNVRQSTFLIIFLWGAWGLSSSTSKLQWTPRLSSSSCFHAPLLLRFLPLNTTTSGPEWRALVHDPRFRYILIQVM